MNKNNFIGIWIVWIVFIWWFLVYKEYINIFGQSIYLQSAAVDPNDIFRWDYVILSYDISTISCPWKAWDTIYIPLLIGSWNIWSGNSCSNNKPSSWLFIAWKKTAGNNIFGIEKYFVQEWKGKEIESYRWSMLISVKIDTFGRSLIKWLITQSK